MSVSPPPTSQATFTGNEAQNVGLSLAVPIEVSTSPPPSLSESSRRSTRSNHNSDFRPAATSEPHLPRKISNVTIPKPKSEPSFVQAQDEFPQSKAVQDMKEFTITLGLPSDYKGDSGPSLPGVASFQSTVKPEDIRRLLGIPEFQPRDYRPTYTDQRNYNYEEKYPEDKPGEENGPDARFFKVYLDEAEIFDQEKIRSHRDNLDSLLVFAALFSAVVTTFAVQTSQALQPNQSLITNYLLLNQIEILKVISNTTAVTGIMPSQYLPDTATHSDSDVWVNGLFFTSLSLSLTAALLSVLAKQWLQAYDSSTSGSARDRALVRHLRYMGLAKWKLDEIIGALPLVLHTSVAVFLIGLVVFLRALYMSISWIIIVIAGFSFTLYLGSVVLPAIDIECPYRIPLLYRPMRYIVLFVSGCYGTLWTVGNWLWSTVFKSVPIPDLPRNTWSYFRNAFLVPMYYIQTSSSAIRQHLQNSITLLTPPLSLTDAERSTVQDHDSCCRYLYYSISWLHEMSSNTSVQRVAAQAIAGKLCDQWGVSILQGSLRAFCTPRLIKTATEGLFDGVDVPPKGTINWWKHPSPWVRAVENLFTLSSQLKNAPSPEENLRFDIWRATGVGRVNHVQYILNHNVDVNMRQPSGYGDDWETPLCVASYQGHQAVVRTLLDHGADMSLGANPKGPALHAASVNGHLQVVELLLEKGAEVNLEAGLYGSALQAASVEGHLEVVKLLLEKGANDNLGVGLYGSALQAASVEGYLELVKLLIEKGADVHLEGGHYGSALQAASAEGYLDIVKLLLEKGADVNSEGGHFGSALQAAICQRRTEVAELLRSHGAIERTNARTSTRGSM